ncbi:hypothetical protein ACHAXT_011048 [Thalassiosira profunda]
MATNGLEAAAWGDGTWAVVVGLAFLLNAAWCIYEHCKTLHPAWVLLSAAWCTYQYDFLDSHRQGAVVVGFGVLLGDVLRFAIAFCIHACRRRMQRWAKITYAKGDVYEGEIRNGLRHGRGVYSYYRLANGSVCNVYDGQWQDGKRHGRGKMTYASGNVYEGEWKDDKKHGRGMTFASGSVYDCQWKNGTMQRWAKITYANGDVYEGEISGYGLRHGKGVGYKFANGSVCNVYDGQWQDGKKHGRGKMTYTSGNFYEGEWKDDRKHGRGKMTYTSGTFYEGEWKDSKKHGRGRLTTADGGVEEGSWQTGQRHGEFTWKGAAVPSQRRFYHQGNLLGASLL